MAINMRQVVNLLKGQGRNVQFYVRKDGGILIKSIDGMKFTGAKGNIYARQVTGTTFSTARAEQLHKITYTGKRAKAYIEDRTIKKMLQRVQRKWNKAFRKGLEKGETPAVGRKTAKGVKWSLEHRGREETIRLLKEAERYASGMAYQKNVEILAMFVEDAGNKYKSQELLDLANSIRDNAWMIKEDSINPAYQELYKLNDGLSPQDIARNVRRILQIP